MVQALIAVLFASVTSGCLSVGAFNTFTEHDDGVRQVVENARFGDGPRRTLDVYAPEGAADDQPVVVFFYGGAWSDGNKNDYSFAGHAFAAQGFITVVPDYRVYPEVRFPEFVDDGAAALRWTQDNIAAYGGDPSRIVMVGHSAGAHIAALLAVDPRYARTAGFDRGAIRGVVGLAGPYRFESLEMPLLRNVFGSADDPLTVQPIHYVSSDDPPLLLLTGDSDRRVPPISSTRMANAARAAGEEAEAKIYPGLDHPGILQALALSRRDGAPVLEDTVSFARRVTEVQSASTTRLPR